MAEETPAKPNHAASIEDVMSTFEGELRRLAERSEGIKRQTAKVFGSVHQVYDHADYVNDVVGAAAARLQKFLGPPPNEINMPRIERAAAEDATIVE